jgi:hypothetical protein
LSVEEESAKDTVITVPGLTEVPASMFCDELVPEDVVAPEKLTFNP